ncbi:Ribokinase-like protein [Blakeslea trispora]|nr:Ribokinase-like protein [Blakeslea trispora]
MMKKHSILLVGQVYLDNILHVDFFPKEDSKLRAYAAEQRLGGNTCNTAQVLAQHHPLNVYYLSAVGSRETSSYIIESLKPIETIDTFIFRQNQLTPSSTIIHSKETSSRTIISNNNLDEISLEEFIKVFEQLHSDHGWWVHFEGRNIAETIRQIEWLKKKATQENWNSNLIISIELEKPDRPDIDLLLPLGDIVFFSKLYAQHHGYQTPASFLTDLEKRLSPNATAFCTWGAEGAVVFDNKTKQTWHALPATVDKVVDSVGAGDTFIAGIIYHMTCFDISLEKALEFACHLATKKVSQQGFHQLLICETF